MVPSAAPIGGRVWLCTLELATGLTLLTACGRLEFMPPKRVDEQPDSATPRTSATSA